MDSATSKKLVADYYLKLYSPAYSEAMQQHLTPDYVEHQYTANFSREGLADYVAQRLADNPDHRVIIHKTFAEDDLVFLFVEEKLKDDVDVARAELFRLEGGRIAEHWGTHVVDEKNRKNDNGTFDGPQADLSVDYAKKAKDRFLELDLKAFDGQEIEYFYETRTPDYKQHSPKGRDGLEGLVEILKKAKESGIKVTMKPNKVLAEGDFLICHRLYDTFPKHPLMNRINTFDLFRFNAEGKSIEHWDVMEDVPEEWMLAKIF